MSAGPLAAPLQTTVYTRYVYAVKGSPMPRNATYQCPSAVEIEPVDRPASSARGIQAHADLSWSSHYHAPC